MNTHIRLTRIASAITLVVGAMTLLACQSAPIHDPAVGAARAELTALQTDPLLANRAPTAIKEAETAVQAAEKPQTDPAVGAHLAYLASNKVKAAHALASARYTEDQLKTVSGQRDEIRLAARTQEADQARLQTESAKLQMESAKQQTAAAERNTSLAEQQTVDANARAVALEKELADLHAKKTDRGMVFTLGDVLFATGKADLKAGAMANFDRLADALKKQEDRHITIEGHTDNVGGDEQNMALSQRRAEAVKSYLVNRGIAADRIFATGKGEGFPVTENNAAAGRQKNRRVEVIIENPKNASDASAN